MLNYVALLLIVLLVVGFAAAIVFIGSLPGKIARKRSHPHPEAVTAASWIGLATGLFWPVAIIWAYLPFPRAKDLAHGETIGPGGELSKINERLAALEAAQAKLQTQLKEVAP